MNFQNVWPGSSFVHSMLPKSDFMCLLAILAVLIGAVLKKKQKHKLSDLMDIEPEKRSKGIPSVSIFTVLKGLFKYGTDLKGISELMLAKYGEVFYLNLFGYYKFVVIANPTMLRKIYMSNEQEYLYKPETIYKKVFTKNLEHGLVASHPELWKIHRSVISKAFSYNGLLRQLNIFEEHSKRFVLNLHEANMLTSCLKEPNVSFDKLVHTLTFEIILHITAGTSVDVISDTEKAQWLHNYDEIAEILAYRFLYPLNLLNFVWKFNPLKLELDKKVVEQRNYTSKVVTSIRKHYDASTIDGLNIDDDMAGKSPVELMIKAGFSNEEIQAEMLSLFVAAVDTTSTTFKLLMLLFANYKDYQDKCRKHIDHMFSQMSASNINQISMDAINSLTFLDMCIKESLRLFAVAPFYGRELKSPTQLDNNTYLPSNTHVMVFTWMIHHNPKIYPEPEKFNPERFSPENVRKRGNCEYMPFSAGPRNCIGYKSAMIELKMLTAYVLHNFDVHSEMSIDDLNNALRKKCWPFPNMDIKFHPRQ